MGSLGPARRAANSLGGELVNSAQLADGTVLHTIRTADGAIAEVIQLTDGQLLDGPSTLIHRQTPSASTTPTITAVGDGTFRSEAGLIYGPDPNPAFANRVDHVQAHAIDNPARPLHGVFSGDALELTDEAWGIAQNGAGVVTIQQGPRTVYYVNMGRDVGYIGGATGAATGNPSVTYIQIVVENGNEIVTSFPVSGIPTGG